MDEGPIAARGCSSVRVVLAHHGRRGGSLALLILAAAGCGAETQKTARTVERACPQLTSGVDPLLLPYSENAAADSKLKTFVSAARGLSDAATKMESLTLDACVAMARDLGQAPASSSPPTIEVACAPIIAEIEQLKATNVGLRVTVSAPECTPNEERAAACRAQCQLADPVCSAACVADGAIYAQCRLPRIEVELSSSSERGLRVAETLRSHLPRLVYAETSLGRRLITHVQSMARAGAALTPDMDKVGVIGATCVVASLAAAAEAGTRIESVLSSATSITHRLVS